MKNKLTILLAIGLLSISLVKAQNQWIAQNSGNSSFLTSVYFVSADTGYVCSEGGNVYKTANGGTNWNSVGTGPGYYLVFENAQKGFGTDGEHILVTQNGGVHWDTCFSNPNVLGIQGISFPDKKHGYAAAWSQTLDNYVIKTSNGGISWDTVYTYANNFSLFMSVFFTDSLNGYVACDNGYILKTTNGGNSFTAMEVDNIISPYFNSVFFVNATTGYLAGSSIYKTTNSGLTWNALTCLGEPFYSIYFTDANHGYVGGGNGINSLSLYQTNNGGSNWTQGASGVQTLNAIFFPDTMPGYAVGTNGTILKYTHASGITENPLSNVSVDLFPNPVSDNLSIEIASPSVISHSILTIYSVQSQLLLQKEMTKEKEEIDVKDLANGVYFLKITTSEGSVVRKFVKE